MIVARHATARSARDTTRAGFTLMEVLVVAAILVILAGTGTIVLFKYLEDSKVSAAKIGVKQIETAAEAYKLHHGSYPSSLRDLTVAEGSSGAYLENNGLIDPWHNEYGYKPGNINPQTRKPLIFSGGSDGSSRITNWDSN